MKPYYKFYGVIITITTMIMYLLWGFISHIESESGIITTAIGTVSAYGTYKLAYKIISFIFNYCNKIKKLILGKYYLDGVWIGVYLGVDNKPVYYIENYYQDFEKIIVKGRCYYENCTYKGAWDSENVTLDIDKNKLIYNYYTDMNNNNFVNVGQAIFNINRDENGSCATKLIGYSKDLFSSKKFMSLEVKYCDGHSTKMNRCDSDMKIIEKAVELYQNNKEFFQKEEFDRGINNIYIVNLKGQSSP